MPMILLVPEGQQGELTLIHLKHPKTKKTVKFAVQGDSLYQVITVDEKAHPQYKKSIFCSYGDDVAISEDSSVGVLAPVNPVFMFLPSIFGSKTALPLSVILELCANEDSMEIPEDLARNALQSICSSSDDDLYKFSMDKTNDFLRALVANFKMPNSMNVPELDSKFSTALHDYTAVNFVSSWLPEKIEQHLRSLFDFDELLKHAEEVSRKAHEAQTLYLMSQKPQDNSKTRKGLKAPSAKKQKLSPKDVKPITSFFSRAPK